MSEFKMGTSYVLKDMTIFPVDAPEKTVFLGNAFASTSFGWGLNSLAVGGSLTTGEIGNLPKLLMDHDELCLRIGFEPPLGSGMGDFESTFMVTGFGQVSEQYERKTYCINFVDRATYNNAFARVEENIEGTADEVFSKVAGLVDGLSPDARLKGTQKYKYYANNLRPLSFLELAQKDFMLKEDYIDILMYRSFSGGEYPIVLNTWKEFFEKAPERQAVFGISPGLDTESGSIIGRNYEIQNYTISNYYEMGRDVTLAGYGTTTYVYDFSTGLALKEPLEVDWEDPKKVVGDFDSAYTANKGKKVKPPEGNYRKSIIQMVLAGAGSKKDRDDKTQLAGFGDPKFIPSGGERPVIEEDDVNMWGKAKRYMPMYSRLATGASATISFTFAPDINVGDKIIVPNTSLDNEAVVPAEAWIDGAWYVSEVRHVLLSSLVASTTAFVIRPAMNSERKNEASGGDPKVGQPVTAPPPQRIEPTQ